MADTNAWLLIMTCFLVIVAFYIKQFLFAVIMVFILVLLAIVTRPAQKHAGSGAKGPLIQPIVIRRKYTGPATLYPEKMHIFEDTHTPSKWREYGPGEGINKALWKGLGRIRDFFTGDDE